MIDVHAHILPDIDDGAPDLETSLAMLRHAAADGITDIIATPHFRNEQVEPGKRNLVIAKVELLNEVADKEGIPVRVHSGAENQACENLSRMLQQKTILPYGPINRYVLIEFPMHQIPAWTELLIFQCLVDNIIPVLSHPERNRSIIKNPALLYDLVIKGALCQMDGPSLLGGFGRDIQKLSERLLQCRLVHFIGSDCHNLKDRKPELSGAKKAVTELLGERVSGMIFTDNPRCLLEGINIKNLVPKNPERFFSGILADLF